MIVIQKRLTPDEIRKDITSSVETIQAWFKSHPERSECVVEVWYGEVVRVQRETVQADLETAAVKAITS